MGRGSPAEIRVRLRRGRDRRSSGRAGYESASYCRNLGWVAPSGQLGVTVRHRNDMNSLQIVDMAAPDTSNTNLAQVVRNADGSGYIRKNRWA